MVIFVIGVVAAIAIPVFLGQRQKGYDAEAKNDLRNLANFEEIYLKDTGSYGTLAAVAVKESPPTISRVALSVVRYDAANGYCLSAMHGATGVTFFYDSAAGAACSPLERPAARPRRPGPVETPVSDDETAHAPRA